MDFTEECALGGPAHRARLDSAHRSGARRLSPRAKVEETRRGPRATLASVSNDVKRSLAALDDAEIQQSLTQATPSGGSDSGETVDYVLDLGERYTLAHLHATGGIGRVWVARDIQLGRDVALKELRPEHAGSTEQWARFLREAQITGQLEHPGVIPVYELSRRPEDHQPFYTMRLIKGRTLTEAVRSYYEKRERGQAHSVEWLPLLNAFVTVCNTIAFAHSRGVIHRDLKGQNVVLGDFGEVIVLDWGLAKLVERPEDESDTAPVVFDLPGSGTAELTTHGQTMGTPSYMAPEQAAGRVDLIDIATDVYGLGAILYEILTGRPPFRARIPRRCCGRCAKRSRCSPDASAGRASSLGGRMPAGAGQAPGGPISTRRAPGPGGPGLAGGRTATGGRGAASVRSPLSFARREHPAEHLSQGPGRQVHIRQPADVRHAGPLAGGPDRQDRLRDFPAGAGGEVSAG